MDHYIFYLIVVTLAVTLHIQISEAAVGSSCATVGNSDCTAPEICNPVTNSCECNIDSYQSGTDCIAKSTHGGDCTDRSQCQDRLSCYAGKCGCQIGTYYSGSNCVSKSGHREPCSTDTSCDSGLICYSSSVCVCPVGKYYRERLTCVSINELIPTFSLSSQLTSITLTFVSKPDTGTLYSSSYTARLNPGNIDHNFTTNPTLIPRLSEGTVYRVTVTRTLTLAVVGRTQTTDSSPAQDYSTKMSYNNICITNGTCYDVNMDCYGGKCLCHPGHYWRDRTCHKTARTPTSVETSMITSNTVTVSWVPESPRPGNTSYVVEVLERNEDNEEFSVMKSVTVKGYSINTLAVQGLSSYWKYKFKVNYQSEVPPASRFFYTGVITTEESAPKEVVSLEAKAIIDVYDKVRLSWQCPPQKDGRNGVIQTATVRYESEDQREGVVPKTGERTIDAIQSCSLNDYELDITAEVYYTFTVFISNSFPGVPRVVNRYMQAGPAVIRTGGVSKQQKAVSDKENTVPLAICPECLLSRRNGLVEISGVLVCKNKCPTDRRKRELKMKEYYEGIDNWQKASKGGFSTHYRASPPSWLDRLTSTDPYNAVYEIGSNSACDASDENGFCNGPLPEGSTFVVYVFVCTTAGCALSDPVTVKTKEPKSNIGLIAGAVGGVVAVIIIVIDVIMLLKLRKPKKSEFSGLVDGYHTNIDPQLSQEWREIYRSSPIHSSVVASLDINRRKNCFVNILAYDHTRVKLLRRRKQETRSDYINANYIHGYSGPKDYIASQGPMAATVDDFWQMVWEQNVPAIVQLTEVYEKHRFTQYWPGSLNERIMYGDIAVEVLNASLINTFTLKTFKVSMGSETRTVKHFFLQDWHYNNPTPLEIIDFAKHVRTELETNNSGPMVVHSSAGVGRTGTFICVDYFLQVSDRADLDYSIDIFSFVLKMRNCRPLMVQTERQYVFVHDVVKEMIKANIRKHERQGEEVVYQNLAFEGFEEEEPSNEYTYVDTRDWL